MNKEVDKYINSAPETQREIMDAVRSLIHQNMKNVVEEFKWDRPVFKLEKDIAYLHSTKNHVSLGFYRDIDKLDDPKNRLEGTGKTMRHIKLRTMADVDNRLLSQWFKALSRNY